MRRNTVFALISALVFVVTECVLSYYVQRSDFVTEAMYFAVVLAFVYSMTSLYITHAVEYNLVRLGLLITLLADYFLVVCSPARQLGGVIVFCFVQMAYFAALILTDENRLRRILHIAVRGGLTLLILPIALIVLGDSVDALAIFSAVYYVNLICNMVFAFVDFRKWWLLGIGLFAFALCDASIGLEFLANSYLGAKEGGLIDTIVSSGVNLAWVFYIPCLTLISLSTHFPFRRKGELADN